MHKRPKKLNATDEAALARFRQVEQLSEALNQMPSQTTGVQPHDPPSAEVFLVSVANGQAVTACHGDGERDVLKWMFNGVHGVLSHGVDKREPTTWLLQATKSILLNSQPKTPVEALLIQTKRRR